MSNKPLTMQDICEFEKNPQNDAEIGYRNAIRHLLRSAYAQCEMKKHMEEDLWSRKSIDSFYRYMFGEHPAENENKDLFSESICDDANAELKANSITDQFFDYISGYRNAADVLVMHAMITGNKGYRDSTIFPVCFLYRQYIELSLKDMYLYYSADSENIKSDYMKKASHDLWHVWENKVSPMIKPLLEQQMQIDEYDLIEKYIKEFQDLDANSYMFRYPISKARQQYHTSSRKINIVGLMEKMRKIEHFFAVNSAFLDPVKMHRECNDYRNMARAFLEKGRLDDAISSYSKALKVKMKWNGEKHPDVIFLYIEISAVYMMQDKHEQAMDLLLKAFDISDQIRNTKFLHILYQNKGMILTMQKDSEKAIEAFDKSIEFDPGDDPLIVKSYLYAARENRKIGRHTCVQPYYERALLACETLLGIEHEDYISLLNEKTEYVDKIAR